MCSKMSLVFAHQLLSCHWMFLGLDTHICIALTYPQQPCWHRVEADEAHSQQSVSVQKASEVRIPKPDLSTQHAYFSEISVLALKDIFHLADYQAMHPLQTLHTYWACGKQFQFSTNQCQNLHSKEKYFRRYEDRASFVKNCTVHVSEKLSACQDIDRELLASSDFLYHQAWGDSHRRTECRDAFHIGQRHKCSKYAKTFSLKYKLFQYQGIYA